MYDNKNIHERFFRSTSCSNLFQNGLIGNSIPPKSSVINLEIISRGFVQLAESYGPIIVRYVQCFGCGQFLKCFLSKRSQPNATDNNLMSCIWMQNVLSPNRKIFFQISFKCWKHAGNASTAHSIFSLYEVKNSMFGKWSQATRTVVRDVRFMFTM